jgi:hypothetical protein
MVIPDRDFVISELGEACERTQGVVVVVEDGHIHENAPGVGRGNEFSLSD